MPVLSVSRSDRETLVPMKVARAKASRLPGWRPGLHQDARAAELAGELLDRGEGGHSLACELGADMFTEKMILGCPRK